MIDYISLRALNLVVQTGSFEKAAAAMCLTPSAISQRVKQLEERLGTVLVIRGTPCTATEKGEWLCRHMALVGLMEQQLLMQLPGLADADTPAQQVTLHIATNADSLGSWFLPAIANFSKYSGYLFNIILDDQNNTAEWLQRGHVVAAVTALAKPVAGCQVTPLGSLQYCATASPEFYQRYFQSGVTAETLAQAPSLTFNQKDQLQGLWVQQVTGQKIACPTHWLPSTQGFIDATLAGMGWGMNPSTLVEAHLRSGQLVEIMPNTRLETPLFWQIHRLASQALRQLTSNVLEAAVSMTHAKDTGL